MTGTVQSTVSATVSDVRCLIAGAALAAALAFPAQAQDLFVDMKESCAACHGVDAADDVPALGGIDAYYALLQLVAFRSKQRENEVMNAMVADFSNDDLRAAADWIASLPRPDPPANAEDPDTIETGEALATEYRCNSCHGADYLGGHQIPPLRNQRMGYILKSLHDYKASRRIGDRAAMVEIATPLTDDEMLTLASYLANLK